MFIEEKCFLREGKLFRPFSKGAKVKCRGYSRALQRAITDFGADSAFGICTTKIKEHYGIEVPASSIRLVVQRHAQNISRHKGQPGPKEEIILSATDGSLIPIVQRCESAEVKDLRKAKKVCWKEVKLSFARGKDKIKRFYGGLIGTAEESGNKMLECAF